jgi:hypothetical protein
MKTVIAIVLSIPLVANAGHHPRSLRPQIINHPYVSQVKPAPSTSVRPVPVKPN